MSFRTIRVVSDSEIELSFEGDDGSPVIHLMRVEPAGRPLPEGTLLTNGFEVFPEHTRLILDLAAAAHRVAAQTFPAGETLDRIEEEAMAARRARWEIWQRNVNSR